MNEQSLTPAPTCQLQRHPVVPALIGMFFSDCIQGEERMFQKKTLSLPPARNRRFIFMASLGYNFRVNSPEHLEEIFGKPEEEPNETV